MRGGRARDRGRVVGDRGLERRDAAVAGVEDAPPRAGGVDSSAAAPSPTTATLSARWMTRSDTRIGQFAVTCSRTTPLGRCAASTRCSPTCPTTTPSSSMWTAIPPFTWQLPRATHNPVLGMVLSSISEILRESRRRTFAAAGEMPRARQWHQDIYAAVAARDAQAARLAMIGHLEQVQAALSRFIQAQDG